MIILTNKSYFVPNGNPELSNGNQDWLCERADLVVGPRINLSTTAANDSYWERWQWAAYRASAGV